MPYYQVDPEAMEEYGAAPNETGAFYESAEATFDFNRANEFMKIVRDALVAKGFTQIQVKYDGGYDEGFSHFDFAVVNGVQFDKDELRALLCDTPVTSAAEFLYDDYDYPAEMKEQMRDRIRNQPPDERIIETLEEFSMFLASTLLGDGFGTGEYELRGQFRADLKTGQLNDIEGGE